MEIFFRLLFCSEGGYIHIHYTYVFLQYIRLSVFNDASVLKYTFFRKGEFTEVKKYHI